MSAAPPKALIKVENLHKWYDRLGERVNVLKGIDLEINRGEAVAVVGVSGAGKSTLLHIIGTLEPPSQGSVIINDNALNNMNSKLLADFRNKHMGFVFQFHHLLPEFSALENTMMPALIARMSATTAREKAKAILAELGLEHRLTHKAGELSGGEQQRVAIARAMILEPNIILADEPTGNLDAATGKSVIGLLRTLNREKGVTLLIVTHNESMAGDMDYIVRLYDGTVAGVEGR